MDDRSVRNPRCPVASGVDAQSQIDVLTKEEEVLVERTDLAQDRRGYNEAGAVKPPTATSRFAASRADPCLEVRQKVGVAVVRVLFHPVPVANERTHNAELLVGVQRLHKNSKCAGLEDRVV